MKKYHVFITFKNGLKLDFYTDTDVRKVKPHITIHGKQFIIVPEQYAYDIDEVDKITVINSSILNV